MYYDYEIIGDMQEELQKVLYEEFIEEVNWAFAVELPEMVNFIPNV